MVEQHFNLITQPWIKVIDKENNEKEVSLEELFKNIADYRQLGNVCAKAGTSENENARFGYYEVSISNFDISIFTM